MRESLVKYVKKQFGSTFGSRELKELRSEIINNALQRYDEAINAGADKKQAYDTAVDSLGDIKSMLAGMNIPEKRRRISLSITIPIFAVVELAILAVAITCGDLGWGLALALFGTLSIGMIAFGVISLISGVRKKALSIVMIVIGDNILIYVLYFAFMIGMGKLSSMDKKVYDHTAELENISRIELITMIDSGRYEDDLEYSVSETIPPELWASLLERISQIEYTKPFGSPLFIDKGDKMFLITFKTPKDGVTFVLIGYKCSGYGKRVDSRVKMNYEGFWCDTDEWNKLIEDFGE